MGEKRSTLPAELPPWAMLGPALFQRGGVGATSPRVTKVPRRLCGDASTTWDPCTLTALK